MCVIAVHVFAQLEQFGGRDISWSPFFWFVKQYGGAFFVVLSGICVTLSDSVRATIKRGAIVFCCGLILTALTEWLYLSDREDAHVLIQWGVLHLLGFSMMVYPLCRKLPAWVRLASGAAITGVGYYLLANYRVLCKYLFPLGLKPLHFIAMDYFPIMPHFGWFLIGSALGTWLYASRKTRLPGVNEDGLLIRSLCFLGRHSLAIYMIHQPLLYVLIKQGIL